MNRSQIGLGFALLGLAAACGVAFAQDKKADDKSAKPPIEKKEAPKPDAAKPTQDKAAAGQDAGEAMMAEMMKNGMPGDQHKMLAENFAGEWNYVLKSYHGPTPEESTGTCTTVGKFENRYFVGEHKGKMNMPGPDGKPSQVTFEGTATTGFDNATGKYWGTWIDNFSTGAMISTGTYDQSSKTFTYTATVEYGAKIGTSKVREVIRVIDKNKHTIEFFESMGGAPERKTMEITYTRKGTAS